MHVCIWWSSLVLLTVIWSTLGKDVNKSRSKFQNSTENENLDMIKHVETSILSILGLKHKPDVDASKIKVPSYMIHLYNIRSTGTVEDPIDEDDRLSNIISWDDDFPYDTVRSYYHKGIASDFLNPQHSMLLHFNVSGIPSNEILRAVQLRISYERHYDVPHPDALPKNHDKKRKKWTAKDLEYLQRLRVYDVIKPARGPSGAVHRLLDTNIIDIRTNGSVAFDVASALHRWLKRPRTNHGLYVEVLPLQIENNQDNSLHIRLKRSITNFQMTNNQPLLLVRTDDGNSKPRAKRASSFDKVRRTCQRHKLYVDFRKVEWSSWIVAPAGYDAFFCHGECPYPLADHMNSTNHAIVQNLVHSRYPSRVPTSCCVPTEHSAISMLYVDEDERVVLRTYQNMVVEACGCR